MLSSMVSSMSSTTAHERGGSARTFGSSWSIAFRYTCRYRPRCSAERVAHRIASGSAVSGVARLVATGTGATDGAACAHAANPATIPKIQPLVTFASLSGWSITPAIFAHNGDSVDGKPHAR